MDGSFTLPTNRRSPSWQRYMKEMVSFQRSFLILILNPTVQFNDVLFREKMFSRAMTIVTWNSLSLKPSMQFKKLSKPTTFLYFASSPLGKVSVCWASFAEFGQPWCVASMHAVGGNAWTQFINQLDSKLPGRGDQLQFWGGHTNSILDESWCTLQLATYTENRSSSCALLTSSVQVWSVRTDWRQSVVVVGI